MKLGIFVLIVAQVAFSQLSAHAEDSLFTEGFRNARWGMSKAEVREAFSDRKIPTVGTPFYVDSIAGHLCEVSPEFYRDSLYQVVVRFVGVSSADLAGNLLRDLSEILSDKYGKITLEVDGSLYEGQSFGWKTYESMILVLSKYFQGAGYIVSVSFSCSSLRARAMAEKELSRDSTLKIDAGKL